MKTLTIALLAISSLVSVPQADNRSPFSPAIEVSVLLRPPTPKNLRASTASNPAGGLDNVVLTWDVQSWSQPLDVIVRRERQLTATTWGETSEFVTPATPATFTDAPGTAGTYRYQIAYVARSVAGPAGAPGKQ